MKIQTYRNSESFKQKVPFLDLKLLKHKIKPILGQVCWQSRLGYGDEICLEIGKKIHYDSPLLAGEYKGEWQFGSRGSDWKLQSIGKGSTGKILAKSGVNLDLDLLLSNLKVIEGKKISQFKILNFSSPIFLNFSILSIIEFDASYKLSFFVPYNMKDQDLPCWEIFTPNHRILELYPNGIWSDQASNAIAKEHISV